MENNIKSLPKLSSHQRRQSYARHHHARSKTMLSNVFESFHTARQNSESGY